MKKSSAYGFFLFICAMLFVANAFLANGNSNSADLPATSNTDETADNIDGTWFTALERGRGINEVVQSPTGDFFALVEDFFDGTFVANISGDGGLHPKFSISNRSDVVEGIAVFADRRIAVIANQHVGGLQDNGRKDLDRETGQHERFYRFSTAWQSTAETIAQVTTFDEQGAIVWEHLFNEGYDARLTAVLGTNEHLYVAGYEVPQGTTQSVSFIAKFDAAGTLLWSGYPIVTSDDRTSSQWINDFAIGPMGEIIVSGTSVAHYFHRERPFQELRHWLARINIAGDAEWAIPLHLAGPEVPHLGPSSVAPEGLHATENGVFGWGYFAPYRAKGAIFNVGYDGALNWINTLEANTDGENIKYNWLYPRFLSGSGSDNLVIGGRAFGSLGSNRWDAWLGTITPDGIINEFRTYGKDYNREGIEGVYWDDTRTQLLAFGNTRYGGISGIRRGWLMSTLPDGRMSADAFRLLEESGNF